MSSGTSSDTGNAALPGRPRGAVVSGPATARAVNVLAPNPSAMTLDGTNTWLVSEPDSELAVVIDPGPLDDVHLREVIATAEKAGKRIALTLLTHGHPDHAGGAVRFAELTGTKVRALDPALRLGDEGLAAGQAVRVGGLELRVVPTPGHTADSLCFHIPADRAVLTGDTILGRGTTVVAHPDGRLGDYLDSLRRLRSLTVDDGVHTVLPGHGPVLDDAQGAVEFYLAHRAHRLAQVETAVENGLTTPAEVVGHVYAEVDRALWPAAEWSVRAQLEYLREHGLIPGGPES
ncbi:MBL fold metallo-hydrolase [Streptomyces sp. NPDC051211]|uniref:MBL fold metallo-hydrolase n=1 Tax=Streptomyces sp. NPDC051211 TaxID=3154643 RepID=UPI0034504238